MHNDQLDKIHELLEDFDTGMLVTHHRDSPVRARPMAIARVEDNCGLWFFTGRASGKVHEIESDAHVLVTFQDRHSRYVSLSGIAQLVNDRAKARELWNETYKTWFPKGVDDPDLLLIFVRPDEIEYWDNQGVKGLRYLLQATNAYATATRPEVREGEQHAKVPVR